MENNQLLPFERNRYYSGKLLTSADFLAEQTYINNKRRFVNSFMFGDGIVCGLNVFNLDDTSIIVESGVALDGFGREIVFETSAVRKLSDIGGFSHLLGNCARLMLKYREESLHPMFPVSANAGEYESNRVREGWELFLKDPDEAAEKTDFSEFLSSSVLFADADFEITAAIPANVTCSAKVKMSCTVKKLTDTPRRLSLNATLLAPAFIAADGSHEVMLNFNDLLLEKGDKKEISVWLKASAAPIQYSFLLAKPDAIQVYVDGEQRNIDGGLQLAINVLETSSDTIIEQEITRQSFEMRALASGNDCIVLADITFTKGEKSYIIDKIESLGVRKYVFSAASTQTRRDYASYFINDIEGALLTSQTNNPTENIKKLPEHEEKFLATGICEIPLDPNSKKGTVAFSDEIVHGLGAGCVHIEAGFAYLDADPRTNAQGRFTIYGNAELFERQSPPIVYAELAVKVNEERGSFVIAARMQRPSNYVVITLRWVATRLGLGDTLIRDATGSISSGQIIALSPTAVLAPRDTHFFAVTFKNMEESSLSYELTEKDSGEITLDGIYTAPSKEGVYEIRISLVDYPNINTYAYAVVKRKNAKEE